jgi:hypothetical protein
MVQISNHSIGNETLTCGRAGIRGLRCAPPFYPPAVWRGRRTIYSHRWPLCDSDLDTDVGSLDEVALSLYIGQSWKTVCCPPIRAREAGTQAETAEISMVSPELPLA